MRIRSFNPRHNPSNDQGQARRRPFLSCILCKTAGRPHNTHDLIDCRFLPERDKRPSARSRLVTDHPDIPIDEAAEPVEAIDDVIVQAIQADEPSALRVSIVQSPVLNTFYHEHPVTGATSNMVRASSAKMYGFPMTPLRKWLVRLMG